MVHEPLISVPPNNKIYNGLKYVKSLAKRLFKRQAISWIVLIASFCLVVFFLQDSV